MTFVNPFIIAMSAMLSTFLIAISMVPSKNPLTARFEKLAEAGDKTPSQRDMIVQQIVSKERRGRLQARLIEAGWYTVSPVSMTLRELGALGIGITIGLAILLAVPTTFGTVLGGFTALVMWRMPNIFLARAIRARKASIARDLPDFLDILSVTVQAGLAMNAAMLQSAETTDGALRSELDSTLAEIRIGRQRSDSMIALAQRVNEQTMTTTVTAIVQAEKLGSSLADVLAELAKDARDRRWLLAEERAARLPVTMIIPMALFMIPSLYLMIFGPVIATLVHP